MSNWSLQRHENNWDKVSDVLDQAAKLAFNMFLSL